MVICCLQLRSQNEIIVMELCSGGSLFTLLENPANAYGFAEDDFKQVVKDVGKLIVCFFFQHLASGLHR